MGSKTIPTAFFVVDVKSKYNILLGRDWIHANGCVPSTLHQCIIQWVGDQVELIKGDDSVCVVVVAEPHTYLQDGQVRCLTGRDLSPYDYISIGRDGFVPISIKPTDVSRFPDESM